MYYMADVYPVSVHDTCLQIDKLLMFLLHHFETEVKEHESFLQIENRVYQPTDNATQNLGSDIERFSYTLNQMIKNIQEQERTCINLVSQVAIQENTIDVLKAQHISMQIQLEQAMKAIEELKSERNTKQNDNDK